MSNTSVPDNISDCDLDYIANEIINSGEVEKVSKNGWFR